MLAHTQPEELDAGPHKGRPGAERLCAVTREVKPVGDLIRFVIGPGFPSPITRLSSLTAAITSAAVPVRKNSSAV